MRSWKLLFTCLGLWTLACNADDDSQPRPPLENTDGGSGECTSCGGCAEVLPVTTAMHVVGRVDYPDTPPASGEHNGRCWSDWGVEESEVPPERWVHNLEHGGVVFLHHCPDGCDEDLATLRELVTGRRFTLMTSYAQLPTRFAVISWGVRMLSDCLDRQAFEAFYDTHVNRAPESIDAPPAAICASVPDPLQL
jgi:hypothetical protein